MRDGDAFAWFCIDKFLRAALSAADDQEHQQSVRLAVVASVSAVSLAVLPRLLDTVLDEMITPLASADRRQYAEELVDALFEEISERVGDMEKEFAMRWWDEHKGRLRRAVDTVIDVVEDAQEGKGKGRAVEMVSRL